MDNKKSENYRQNIEKLELRKQQESSLQQQESMIKESEQNEIILNIDVNKNTLEKLDGMFKQIDSKYNPKQIIRKMEDKTITNQISHEQIYQFDHQQRYKPKTQNNAKYYTPTQRKSPFKDNLKKSLHEIKRLFKSQYGSVQLSYNKYTPDQIKAFLYSNKDYFDPENSIHTLKSLYLAWVRIQKIIDFLTFKRFQSLKILNIGGNFVESVQMICRIEMPLLQDLFIWNNHLTELRSLRRANWPNLKILDLHVNNIQQARQLRYLGNDSIQSIVFDSNNISNFNQAIVACSRSKKSKISLMTSNIIKFMGRPSRRRRKKAIQVEPCTVRVRYI